LLALAVLIIAVLWAPASMAATKAVPPGLSGANQYSETLAGPGGNTRATELGEDGGRPQTPAQKLGAENARDLEDLGPEGRLAAELAAKTTPRPRGEDGQKTRRHSKNIGAAQSSGGSGGSSGLDQVLGQITGTGGSNSGGMSWLLPLLIGASILTAAAYLLGRRRSARPRG
jgi:hypothetical protein